MELGACILFFERIEQTIECVRSSLPAGIRIHVLNNGSSSKNVLEFEKFCSAHPRVTLHHSPTNLGVAKGRNRLLELSKEEWLLFLDSDITLNSPNWLQQFWSSVGQFPQCEVFIPRLFNVHEGKYATPKSFSLRRNTLRFRFWKTQTLNWFPGGASFVRRKLFDRIGRYDESLFIGYEDFELAVRAMKSGNPIQACFLPKVELRHEHRRAISEEDLNAARKRYDLNELENSVQKFIKKYNLRFTSPWRRWAERQLKKITDSNA